VRPGRVGADPALIGEDADPAEDREDEDPDSVLALIKSVPGNVSLESMLTEIRKLTAFRAVGLPPGLFADVAPKVVAGWRARAERKVTRGAGQRVQAGHRQGEHPVRHRRGLAGPARGRGARGGVPGGARR
jgi:hypothetical protein